MSGQFQTTTARGMTMLGHHACRVEAAEKLVQDSPLWPRKLGGPVKTATQARECFVAKA